VYCVDNDQAGLDFIQEAKIRESICAS
jgi:hypothetical protein